MTGSCELEPVYPAIVTWSYGLIYIVCLISFAMSAFWYTKKQAHIIRSISTSGHESFKDDKSKLTSNLGKKSVSAINRGKNTMMKFVESTYRLDSVTNTRSVPLDDHVTIGYKEQTTVSRGNDTDTMDNTNDDDNDGIHMYTHTRNKSKVTDDRMLIVEKKDKAQENTKENTKRSNVAIIEEDKIQELPHEQQQLAQVASRHTDDIDLPDLPEFPELPDLPDEKEKEKKNETANEAKDEDETKQKERVEDLEMKLEIEHEDNDDKLKTSEIIMKLYDEHNKLRIKQFLKLWFHDLWIKRKCYFPILTHIIDQMTDVGIIVAFYLLHVKEEESDLGSDYCEEINPLSLFILSLISFWFYRITTATVIYIQTKSWYHVLLQLFDLQLFRALVLNYVLKTQTPSNPQRWIQSLEAVFEAFPQTLIQLFYVTKTDSFNFLVVFSLIWSLWAIVNKTANEDLILFNEKYQKANYHLLSIKYWKKLNCMSKYYAIRIIYRAGDVLWRVLTLLLIWVFAGGFATTIIVGVEFTGLAIMASFAKELSIVSCMRQIVVWLTMHLKTLYHCIPQFSV